MIEIMKGLLGVVAMTRRERAEERHEIGAMHFTKSDATETPKKGLSVRVSTCARTHATRPIDSLDTSPMTYTSATCGPCTPEGALINADKTGSITNS